MLEIPALFSRRPRWLGRAGELERPAAAQDPLAEDCWQTTWYLRLPRLEAVPVQRAPDLGERGPALARLSMQDRD